uniref:Deoxyhypusine synthase n=1 Tax=Panagrolaimus sp. PS1159 TaxID=55785 RepID=A0AC35GHE3_9BILA
MSIGMDLSSAHEAVLVRSEKLDEDTPKVRGYDFNEGINYEKLLDSYLTTGFQATNVGLAIEEINKMIAARNEEPPVEEDIDPCFSYPEGRKRPACTIFLGFTSNLVSSGLREAIRFLVQHNLIDCIVTSAGGVEEDLIKCLSHTYLGDFSLPGKMLRQKGLNRIGNLLVPNDNYCHFEEWLMPVLDKCLAEQETGIQWTPSKIITRLGKEINNEDSICYWAYKNNIPIYCPALTDGSLGDMLYFHSVKNSPGIKLDIVEDLRHINTMAVKSYKSGVIILGGGIVKHHINNANLMRNGSDYTVFVNTGQEFDGSDSGARPDEAVSWGKVRSESKAVKVYADATLIFPLLVAKTFAKFKYSA